MKSAHDWLGQGYAGAEYGEWSIQPSDGHAVLQWRKRGNLRAPHTSTLKRKRADPNRGYTTKPETKCPKVAIMQALHTHFHLDFTTITRLCYPNDTKPTRLRLSNVMAVVLYAGGSANTIPWWKRKYQQEAIDEAARRYGLTAPEVKAWEGAGSSPAKSTPTVGGPSTRGPLPQSVPEPPTPWVQSVSEGVRVLD